MAAITLRSSNISSSESYIENFLAEKEKVPLPNLLLNLPTGPVKAVNDVWLQSIFQFPPNCTIFKYEDNFCHVALPDLTVESSRDDATIFLKDANRRLTCLIKSEDHIFWSHLLYDKALQTFIISFLANYRRNFDLGSEVRRKELIRTADDAELAVRCVALGNHDLVLTETLRMVLTVLRRAILRNGSSRPAIPAEDHSRWLKRSLFHSDNEDEKNHDITRRSIIARLSDILSLVPGSLFMTSIGDIARGVVTAFPFITRDVETVLLPILNSSIESYCRRISDAINEMREDSAAHVKRTSVSAQRGVNDEVFGGAIGEENYLQTRVKPEARDSSSASAVTRVIDIISNLLEAVGTLEGVLFTLIPSVSSTVRYSEWTIVVESLCKISSQVPVANLVEVAAAPAASSSSSSAAAESFESPTNSISLIHFTPSLSKLEQAYRVTLSLLFNTESSPAILKLAVVRARRMLLHCLLKFLGLPFEARDLQPVDTFRHATIFDLILQWSVGFVTNCSKLGPSRAPEQEKIIKKQNLLSIFREHGRTTKPAANLSPASSTTADLSADIARDFELVGGKEMLEAWSRQKLIDSSYPAFFCDVWHLTEYRESCVKHPQTFCSFGIATTVAGSQILSASSDNNEIPTIPSGPTEPELQALLEVRDVLDGLDIGDGFILSCLRALDNNPDQVVNAILTESIPADVIVDRFTPIVCTPASTVPREAQQTTSATTALDSFAVPDIASPVGPRAAVRIPQFDFRGLRPSAVTTKNQNQFAIDEELKTRVLDLARQQHVDDVRTAMRAGDEVEVKDVDILEIMKPLLGDANDKDDEYKEDENADDDDAWFISQYAGAAGNNDARNRVVSDDELDDSLEQYAEPLLPMGNEEEDLPPDAGTSQQLRREIDKNRPLDRRPQKQQEKTVDDKSEQRASSSKNDERDADMATAHVDSSAVKESAEKLWGRRRIRGGRWEDDPKILRTGADGSHAPVQGGSFDAHRKEVRKARLANHNRKDRAVAKLKKGT